MQEEDVAAISKSRSDVSPKRPAAGDQSPVVRAEHPASSIQQPASSSQQHPPLIPQPQPQSAQLLTLNSQLAPLPFEPEMILIPAGEFLMGSDPQKDANAREDEQPQHTLYLPEYWIAKTPVTNAQYAAFVQATGHGAPEHWQKGEIPQGKDVHPVVYVTWHDALAYCTWLAEVTGKPYTLPSEAEWEKAARGPVLSEVEGTDGRIYPWGNTFGESKCNTEESGIKGTTPVDKYSQGASPYGVLDMAGNVWEWTRSLWGPWDGKDYSSAKLQFTYPYQADDKRENLQADDKWLRVLRGGAFLDDRDFARCAYRLRHYPNYRSTFIGFRVVVSPPRA